MIKKNLIETFFITILFVLLIPNFFKIIKNKKSRNIVIIHAFIFFAILFIIKNILYSNNENFNNQNKNDPNDPKTILYQNVEKLKPLSVKILKERLEDRKGQGRIVDIITKKWDNSITGLNKLFAENKRAFLEGITSNNEFVIIYFDDITGEKGQVYPKNIISAKYIYDDNTMGMIRKYLNIVSVDQQTGKYKSNRKTYVDEIIGVKKGTPMNITIDNKITKDYLIKNGFTYNKNNKYKFINNLNLCDGCNDYTGPLVKTTKLNNKDNTCNIQFEIGDEENKKIVNAIINQDDIIDSEWLWLYELNES